MALMEDILQQQLADPDRGLAPEEQQSSFFKDAVMSNILRRLPQIGQMTQEGIPDPSVRQAYAQEGAKLQAGVAADQIMQRAQVEKFKRQMQLLESLKSNPELQAAVAERLGIARQGSAANVIGQKIQRQMQLEAFKSKLASQRSEEAFARELPFKAQEAGRRSRADQSREAYQQEQLQLQKQRQANSIYSQMQALATAEEKYRFSNPAVSTLINQLMFQLLMKAGGVVRKKGEAGGPMAGTVVDR